MHSQVEFGKDLINAKTNQLQDEKTLATTLLESVSIQIKLLEQHQQFYRKEYKHKDTMKSSFDQEQMIINCFLYKFSCLLLLFGYYISLFIYLYYIFMFVNILKKRGQHS